MPHILYQRTSISVVPHGFLYFAFYIFAVNLERLDDATQWDQNASEYNWTFPGNYLQALSPPPSNDQYPNFDSIIYSVRNTNTNARSRPRISSPPPTYQSATAVDNGEGRTLINRMGTYLGIINESTNISSGRLNVPTNSDDEDSGLPTYEEALEGSKL